MKTLLVTLAGMLFASLTSCVNTQVEHQLDEHSAAEGLRHADEVLAQSPFDTVKMSWSEAEALMEVRNREYKEAEETYEKAVAQQPLIKEFAGQAKKTATVSIGDVLKPSALLKTVKEPTTQIPQQLASISKIKDFSHDLEQDAWNSTAQAVDAEMKMREEKVKLYSLLRKGALLDREMEWLESLEPLPEDANAKMKSAFKAWRNRLEGEKNKWLTDVRNLFDAEYHDVHFVQDQTGLPTYRKTDRPDLTDWPRWAQLRRSKKLVSALSKEHKESKPTIPGTKMVKSKVSALTSNLTGNQTEPTLATKDIRSEVRKLIQSWREMKNAQRKAEELEKKEEVQNAPELASINDRQAIYNLRNQEIQHASVVWLMDEQCWP
ncbi:MAG: hypothetical protein Q7Q71_05915 [Verrucomicrobiota bacterium JB023]|nr:hypothetical protein [Verrucomicrobiota bacterium JB023]